MLMFTLMKPKVKGVIYPLKPAIAHLGIIFLSWKLDNLDLKTRNNHRLNVPPGYIAY